MGEVAHSVQAAQVEVLEQVASGAPLPEILEAIVRFVERQASGMLCSILLYDAEHQTLHHGAGPSLPAAYMEAIDGTPIGPDQGSCGAAAYFRERFVVEDVATHPNWTRHRHLLLPYGLRACWSTPFVATDQQLLGTLAMYYEEPRGPTLQEQGWVEAATHLAAIAIERDRAVGTLRRSEARARHLARLYAVSSSVNEAVVAVRDPQQILDQACRIAVEKGLAQLAWIGAYREDEDRIEPCARYGIDDGYVDSILLRLRDRRFIRGPAARAMHDGEVAISNDVANDPNFYFKDEAVRRGLRSCAAFPLRLAEGIRGVLAIYGASAEFFGAEEIKVLSSVADHLSLAIEGLWNEVQRRRAEAALRERESRLRLLHRLGEATRGTSGPDEVLPIALRLLAEHLGVMRCTFVDIDVDGTRCTVPHQYNDGCAPVPGSHKLSGLGARLAADLDRGGVPVVIRDVDVDLPPEDAALFRSLDARSFMCCTLVRGGRCHAMLGVHTRAPRDWTAEEVQLFGVFTESCWATVEQRAAEARLRSSEELLRIAGQAARLGGFVLDLAPELRVIWSDEVCAIHGMPPGTVPTVDEARALYSPELRAVIQAAIESSTRDRAPFDVEGLIDAADGRSVWVRIVGRVERDSAGAPVRILGAVQDVSERRKLEEELLQARKMEAVGQLAGGIAHDFNNLLTVIVGYTHLIAGDLDADAPLRQDIDEIRKAAERAGELTGQLLAFGRRQLLKPRVVDLDTIAAGLEKMLRRMLRDDIDFSLIPSRVLGKVMADPGKIEQVIMNLVVNARDAMPRGGRLTIETGNAVLGGADGTSHRVVPGAYVVLTVTDTGVGMDAITRAHIFEPFFTTKEQGKGTGLGLSTVYGIVSQSGGHIMVDSEPGAGAVFRVYLPRIDGEIETVLDDAVPTVAVGGNETILLVEDDDQVRAIVRSVLDRNGYDVLVAHNGGEAFLICERFPMTIELMITDVMMPRMNGRELAERLAPLRPSMKVLFISGYAEDAVVQNGVLDAGIAFLAKPMTPEALLRKVREVLGDER